MVPVMIFLIFSLDGASAQDYTPETLFITLFADGKSMVEYRLNTDVNLPTITVTLFGMVFEDVLVVDDQEQFVDYRIEDASIIMDTFGAPGALITYTTADLVNKTGRLWTFSVDSPVDVSVKLPAESVIIGLNQIPDSIKTIEDQYLMVMPAGYVEISYVLGVLGTKEHASAAISTAEKMITDLKSDGIVVSEAEARLQEAKAAFERGSYSDAEKLANEADSLANATKQDADLAAAAITDAEVNIEDAGKKGASLAEASDLLGRATTAYNNGSYKDSLQLAQQAKTAAMAAVARLEAGGGQGPFYIIAGIAGAAGGGVAAAFYVRARRKSVSAERLEVPEHIVKEKRVIDLNRILAEKPYLRPEDKEALTFLAEKGGEAFESELRDKFQLPKTTMWRLVKRLEREDLVEIKKAGGQNLIRIRQEFTRKDQGPV